MANIIGVIQRAMSAWRPPERLRLSEWADRHFVLSPETAAEPGRWHCLPYQVEILDAISDPDVRQVTLMKSARVGYTLMLSATIAYHIAHEPTSILICQPTVEDAKNFSKESLSPMLRDVPALARTVFQDFDDRGKGPKDSSSTLMHKAYPGGILSLIGANSGTGFRRVSRRVILFDEIDAYPPSAGNEGDPISLGMQRGAYFWNRKVVSGSTPLVAGASRIEQMFESGDQRHFFVPCPNCGHMDFLTFNRKADRGHVMRWPDGDPDGAFFECRDGNCVIEERDKLDMLRGGEWRPDKPGGAHRSYHLWAAYSLSPNATWSAIANEFLEAKRAGPERLRVFVNTTLAETFRETGEAPDYEVLYQRREPYPIGTVPASILVVTCGVDVQRDRLVYECVGWAPDKENWSIDCGELFGDTAGEEVWGKLDALLSRTFAGTDGSDRQIAMLAIDSGYNTQVVYGWCRQYPMSRVIACKGVSGARALVGAPSPVDVTVRGRRMQRGYKVWPIGVDIAKSELYGMLRLRRDDSVPPPGYCHFPEYGENYFRQLTAEHLVTTINRRTHRARMEWQVIPNRENHYLDARILARVAAAVLGIDRLAAKRHAPPEAAAKMQTSTPTTTIGPSTPAPSTATLPFLRRGWLRGLGPRGEGRGWLGRRR